MTPNIVEQQRRRGRDHPTQNDWLIRSVLRAIEVNPDRWNQLRFIDATGHVLCFASWTLHLAGENPLTYLQTEPSGRSLVKRARRLLGLPHQKALKLFYYGTGDVHPSVFDLKNFLRQEFNIN